jgi:type II secretory pathway component GspD/PulD (secretin)
MIPSTHRTAFRGLLIAALLLLSLAGLTAQQEPARANEETISIQFPHTSVAEVLTVYEKLTGKRLIRDSNLAGPELSIMVTDPVPHKEAVSLIESSGCFTR